MHLRRCRDSGTRGRWMTSCRWLACTGLAAAGGLLLVACAEPPAPTTSGRTDDPSAVAADTRSAAETTESPSDPPDVSPSPPDVSPSPPDSPSDEAPEPDLMAGPIVLPPGQPVTGTDVKLDGVLLELVRARRRGGEAGVLAYAEQHRPGLSVDRLQVEVVCTSAETGMWVREQIAAAGGTVTASLENYIWADLSLDGVETLVAAEAVWTIAVSQVVVEPVAR